MTDRPGARRFAAVHARASSRHPWTLGGRALTVVLAGLVAGCSGPVLANPPLDFSPPPSSELAPPRDRDPVPVVLPRDDGPHQRLTEWWYYTGHLAAADGRRFGYEAVIFRAERGDVPVTWASHLALTDESGDRFLYGQRSQVGGVVDTSPHSSDGTPTGFALGVTGFDPRDPTTATRSPWSLAGSGGHDRISAALSASEVASAGGSFGLSLDLTALTPPVLHDRDGWIDFGPAGGSYYYSRPEMRTTGTLTLDGRSQSVTGTSWFDHQWGDFISVGGGGWDWFAVNLEDGTDLTLSLVRAADGSHPLVYGTLISPAQPDGTRRVTHLDRSAFSVDASGHWTSPRTGATYPAGWRIRVPAEDLAIDLTPTVAAQELDTRATTGVVYWEGSQRVSATRGGRAVAGQAYVELTGYATAAAGPTSAPTTAP
jgi:predicted secreted hydrolase